MAWFWEMSRPPIFNLEIDTELQEAFARHIGVVREAQSKLDEQQLFACFVQALKAGDFIKFVAPNGHQQIVYLPLYALEELRKQYHELIYAVERKFDGETRHETALRYIMEKEKEVLNPCNAGAKEADPR